jgi:hypothetical protein
MELGAVSDAADGGIADRGGGRGSYRVIDFKPAKFCSGPIVWLASLAPGCRSERSGENRAVFTLIIAFPRARGERWQQQGIDLLDLLAPAVWRSASGCRRHFVLANCWVSIPGRRWSSGR